MLVAIAGAALGWAALVLQAVLTLSLVASQGGTLPDGLWRYLGFFTVIANLFAAVTLTLAALRRGSSRREFCAATAMVLVGVVYSLLLRETWNPQGWQKVADVALHDAMPVIVLLFWLLRPHGALRRGDIAASLVLPLAYCAYALARGAIEGWYAYGFLDAGQFGAAAVAINCGVIALAFGTMALALVGIDRLLARYWQV
ncbi:MAG TPA: Pr6Pr family membrane protein [Rhizomicrobium sp.]